MDNFGYRALQKGCKGLGLKASGSKAALFWRIVVRMLRAPSAVERKEQLAALAASGAEIDVGHVVAAIEDLDASGEKVVRAEMKGAEEDAPVNAAFIKACLRDPDSERTTKVVDILDRLFGYRHDTPGTSVTEDTDGASEGTEAITTPDATPEDVSEAAADDIDNFDGAPSPPQVHQATFDVPAALLDPVAHTQADELSKPSPYTAKRGRTPANTPSTATRKTRRRTAKASQETAASMMDETRALVASALKTLEATLGKTANAEEAPLAPASTSKRASTKQKTPRTGKRVNFAKIHDKAFSAQKAIGGMTYRPSAQAARTLSFAGVTADKPAHTVTRRGGDSARKVTSLAATIPQAAANSERRKSSGGTASWLKPCTFKIKKSAKKPTEIKEFRLSANRSKQEADKKAFTPYSGAVPRLPVGTPASLIFDRENMEVPSANRPTSKAPKQQKSAGPASRREPVKKSLTKQIEQRRTLQSTNARDKRRQRMDDARAAAVAS